jgi:MipA family protein
MMRRCLIVAAGVALPIGIAAAQEGLPPPMGPMQGDLEFSVGLLAAYGPRYPGSDENRTRALPLINLRSSAGWFVGVGGIGMQWGDGPLQYGLRLGIDRGRDQDDADALRGMGDVPVRAEYGGFVSYRIAPMLMLQSGLRYGSGEDRKGGLFDLGLRSNWPLGDGQRVGLGVSTTYANQAAMRSLFGVTAAQSATSGYGIYEPQAGWRDMSLNANYGLAITPQAMLNVGMNYRRLLGDAKTSPLTRSANSTGLQAGILYRF